MALLISPVLPVCSLIRTTCGVLISGERADQEKQRSSKITYEKIHTPFSFCLAWRHTCGYRRRKTPIEPTFGAFASFVGENVERNFQRLETAQADCRCWQVGASAEWPGSPAPPFRQ